MSREQTNTEKLVLMDELRTLYGDLMLVMDGKEFTFPDWFQKETGMGDFCRYHVANFDRELAFYSEERWKAFVRQRHAACAAWLLANS